MGWVVAAHRSEACQYLQRPLALSDSRIKLSNSIQDIFLVRRARFEFGKQPEGPRPIASLQERVALLEHEFGIVWRRPNQTVVLGDGTVQFPERLKEPDHLQAEIDLPWRKRERLAIRGEGRSSVARLFIEATKESQAPKVSRVLGFEVVLMRTGSC